MTPMTSQERLKDKLIARFIYECENENNCINENMEEQIRGIAIDKEFNDEKIKREKKGSFIP